MDCNFGRLFIVGFEGTKLNKALEAKLQDLNPAGIIFYDTNIESAEQVRELIRSLKNLLGANLIVTVDQEGGKVERLRKVTTSLPSLQALGRASIRLGREQGLLFAREPLINHSSVLAEELSELGFNLVLAPCADISTNPLNPIIGTRSLGADPTIVSEQLKIIIQTYQEYGVKSCAKHFPGHGDTSIDSHLALPVQQHSLDEYLLQLKPFISAIEAGAESVMMAHLITSYLVDSQDSLVYNDTQLANFSVELSGQLPASISPGMIQYELRNSLGFKGLVISDEITMKALAQYGTYAELSQKMLEAGNNLVIWNTNLDDALQAARYLNGKTKEDNKLLYDSYYRSIELLKLDSWEAQSQASGLIDKEEKMLKIVEAAIHWNKSSNEIRESLEAKPTAVLIYDHPKLEMDVIKAVLDLDAYKFSGKETSLEFLEPYDNLLVLSFQTINNIDQDNFIIQLRNQGCFNVVQCSCDMPDNGAEVYLFGANKVHYRALAAALGLYNK